MLVIDDCMMSENDPGVLAAPPSTTLPSTDLQNATNTLNELLIVECLDYSYIPGEWLAHAASKTTTTTIHRLLKHRVQRLQIL